MEFHHTPMSANIDLTTYTSQHSADQLVIYKRVDQEPLYLGYYFPPAYDSTKKYPAFVFIHGGAWEGRMVFDDQNRWQGDYLGFLARYYAEKGFVCISIDYRLVRSNGQVPRYGLIECYEDCHDAMEYIHATASNYGIDLDKIYLLGESAGGHLAGCVATFEHKKVFSFTTVFLINPITDLNDPVWRKYVPESSLHTELSQKSFHERVNFLSPLYRIGDHTSKIVLLHGGADTCVDAKHSVSFYEKMRSVSLDCDLHILEQTNHAFLLVEYSHEMNACQTGIQIINNYLF